MYGSSVPYMSSGGWSPGWSQPWQQQPKQGMNPMGNMSGGYQPMGFDMSSMYGGYSDPMQSFNDWNQQPPQWWSQPPSWWGQQSYTGGNPLQRGGANSGTNTGFNSFGPQAPTGSPTQTAGMTPASNYTPTTPTYSANPVTDPSLAASQAWGQSGGAPTLIPTVTASMLGYGTAPPGAKGYNPNTGQWE